ncbi:MAG: hypothetical protein ACLR1V_06780 [Coprococcus sp.]
MNVDAAANPYQTVSSVEHLFYLPKDTIFQLERICRENLRCQETADIHLDRQSQKGRFAETVEELAALEKNLFREKVAATGRIVPESIRAYGSG